MLDLSMRYPESYTLKNPARAFIEDGAPDFGFTEPFYNGVSAISRKCRGVMEPVDFDAPTITYTNGSTFTAQITRCAQHDISWEISLPERPLTDCWQYTTQNGPQILKVLNDCFAQRAEMFSSASRLWLSKMENKNLLQQNTSHWKIQMFPGPGVTQFMSHILAHEYQHVEDHAWLAEEIIRPLDTWHEKNHNRVFTSATKDDLYGIGLAGVAVGNIRILRYWQKSIIESGHLYHHTLEGGHPDIKIVSIDKGPKVTDEGLIRMTVTPNRLLPYTGFDLDDPLPHCFQRGQVFSVHTGIFTGNEPALSYITTGSYHPRVVHYIPPNTPALQPDTDISGLFGTNDD